MLTQAQVVGDGPFDLVFVPGFISHLDLQWADPRIARFLEKLTSFSQLIMFDKRGTGLSDPVAAPAPLEDLMDDVRVDACVAQPPPVAQSVTLGSV